jgi:hypothetical protein
VTQEFVDTDELRGARFQRADLTGALFRDVDLTSIKVTDALLIDADISGLITGLKINDVEVAPLISDELDRRHPERVLLRSTDPEGLQRAWDAVEAWWRPTLELARSLPESCRQQRVGEEWSLVETLRHLICVTDAWFGRAVLGESQPYHPLGLVPAFLGDGSQLGLTTSATPSFDEVVAVREERMAKVARYLATVTPDDLSNPRALNDDTGYPPAIEHTVLQCLHVVMDEEWNHHRYAERDLRIVSEGS